MINSYRQLKDATKILPASYVFHFTPVKNVPLILSRGLRPDISETACTEIWFCSRSVIRWAWLHVIARHRARALALFAFHSPHKKRRRAKCIHTTTRPINAQFVGIVKIGGTK
jgi:hypothetical protein